MSSSKISPVIPLVIGVIFIGAALAGIVLSLTSGDTAEKPEKKKVVARASVQRPQASASTKPKAVEQVVEELPPEISEAELRKQTTRILLGRIAKMPTKLDLDWLAATNVHVRNPAELDRFFLDYMKFGEKGLAALDRAQKRSKKILSRDPRYFISLANATFVAKKNTEAKLLKGVKENLSLALYIKQDEVEGLENVEEAFMGDFFKKLLLMYHTLEGMAIGDGKDPEEWMQKRMRTLEAAIFNRYMNVERRKDMARKKIEGTGNSIAGTLFRTDRLEKAINANLLELGRVYYDGASREVIDREKHQYYADQAFKVLSMIYQRSHSGEALNLMREVNGIQRDYLHRLARTNWKRAQLAAAAGRVGKADESYFVATQRYLQCMSQSVETQRELVAKEFRILKKEIAQWQAKKKMAPVKAAGG